jgi:hypothetical protein
LIFDYKMSSVNTSTAYTKAQCEEFINEEDWEEIWGDNPLVFGLLKYVESIMTERQDETKDPTEVKEEEDVNN